MWELHYISILNQTGFPLLAFAHENAPFVMPDHFSFHITPSRPYNLFFATAPSPKNKFKCKQGKSAQHVLPQERHEKKLMRGKSLQSLPLGNGLQTWRENAQSHFFGSSIVHYSNHSRIPLSKKIKFQSTIPYAIMNT